MAYLHPDKMLEKSEKDKKTRKIKQGMNNKHQRIFSHSLSLLLNVNGPLD